MKKLLVLLTLVFIMAACAPVDETYNGKMPKGTQVIILDGCEYVTYGYGMAHKGNCKYCQYRREKETEELISKLKNDNDGD